MTNAQLASIQWGVFLSVVFLLPQLLFRQLTFRGATITVYASMLFAATFLPVQTVAPRQSVQLVPFQWIADTFRDGQIAFDQMTLNVLLFVPLGAMLMFWGGRTIGQAALIGYGVSLLIEGSQLLWANRIFDVDDLITNTTGTALGWLGALAAVKVHARVTAAAVPQRELAGVR
ncbi:VanZ like family protein [Lentzea albidocapillata subsp. violacea]|uniref:VanZ like family protein n=1 Tax=Lentzea albidocapillata subsp. violacea TaxID=128104 RepID=A0A1G8WDP5_9PSEU|nr:VanZ family protein [Lentzea albidocapillata]SDJ76343.1 VanZ like family protein [Lentzea albidocapillata subsp. violacea]